MKQINKTVLPISDTIPGPGNFQAEVIDIDGQIPTVKTDLPVGHLGHGTAEDISSTDMTPDPMKAE